MQLLARRILVLVCIGLGAASTAAAASPSQAAFVKRANAICTKENTQANVLAAPNSRSTTATYLAKTIAIVERARTATLALPAPVSDQSLIKAETTAVANELAYLRKAKAAVVSNEPSAYQTDVEQVKSFSDSAAAFAKKLGLASCQA
jgi:hypothetical protein